MIKAASVVRGEFIGEASTTGNVVHVPQYVAWTHAQTCYAFDGETTAGCASDAPGDPGAIVKSRTTAGLYNPVYYLAVGWPTLLIDSSAGIYAMRLMSAALASAFLALAFMLVSAWRRPALPTAALTVVATPMLLFLNASVNPNAVEATATLAVFAAMLSLLREPDHSLLAQRSSVLAVAGAVAVNARGLSPLWVAVAVILPLFLVRWGTIAELLKRRAVIVAASVVALSSAFAVFWLLRTNSLAAAVTDPDALNLFPGVGQPAIYGFVSVLEGTFGFSAHLIGLFGWMDTPSPTAVSFVWAVAIGALVAGALAVSRGRELWVFVTLVAAFVLLPPIIQGAYVTGGGYIWQGRYNFPLFACLLLAAGTFAARAFDRVGQRTRERLAFIGLLALAVAQFYVFVFVLRRYVVGIHASWLDFITEPEWAPPLTSTVLIALMATASVFVYFIAWKFLAADRRGLSPAVARRASE